VDNSQGVRKRHGKPEERYGKKADLLSEQQTPTVVDAVRSSDRAGWRRDTGSGADPESTEEILATRSAAVVPARAPAAATGPGFRLPRRALEPTHPVDAESAGRDSSPGQLPDFSRLLAADSPVASEVTGPRPRLRAKGAVLAGRSVVLGEGGGRGLGVV
jgi:hypothetical protein